MILGIISRDSGDFTWFEDKSTDNHRKRIGAILETPNFYPYLNAEENLEIISQIKGVKDQDYESILKTVNLYDRRNSKFRSYSLGMKQRLAIGATLVGDPDVVIFDEPTNGLDPEGIAEVRNILKKVASGGKTVLMASHILDEVEKVCTHVAIIKNGNLLANGNVGSILSSNLFMEIGTLDMDKLKEDLSSMPAFIKISLKKGFFECEVNKAVQISAISTALVERGHVITHLVSRKRSLEKEFLEIVK
jgi:ABC-2 type transport system ATP-binding protein